MASVRLVEVSNSRSVNRNKINKHYFETRPLSYSRITVFFVCAMLIGFFG